MSFTANPAYPHPDQDSDNVKPMELGKAVELALKVLRNPNAELWHRRAAADDLEFSYYSEAE